MPDIECRVANLETRMSNIEVRSAGHEEKVIGMSEVLTERRRQGDNMIDILVKIREEVADIKGFARAMKWLAGLMATFGGGLAIFILGRVFGSG